MTTGQFVSRSQAIFSNPAPSYSYNPSPSYGKRFFCHFIFSNLAPTPSYTSYGGGSGLRSGYTQFVDSRGVERYRNSSNGRFASKSDAFGW